MTSLIHKLGGTSAPAGSEKQAVHRWKKRDTMIRRFAAMLSVLLLAGCQSGLLVRPSATATAPAQATPPDATATAPVAATPVGTTVPTGTLSGGQTITVWVPPQFSLDAGSPGGSLLKARLDSFTRENSGVQIVVRVKAVSGPGSLVEALTAASAAAPEALPDLVAISQPDLEVAALKGLLTPFDGLTSGMEDADWYHYARQLAIVQGSTFGLPFAGDALIQLYRPAQVAKPPADWDALLQQTTPVIFPAADPQALFTLALYRGEGGQIADAQGRPMLSVNTLSQILNLYEEGERKGVIPAWVTQLETDGQVWQAYRDQRAQTAITWVSRYLAETPADTTAAPLPSSQQTPSALATGWSWALTSNLPERKAISAKLAEYLVGSSFLAKWTEAAGYLPTRPTSLAGWSNQSMQTLLSPVVLSAEARPANDVLGSLGPILRDAALQALKEQSDPSQTAQTAAQRLNGP